MSFLGYERPDGSAGIRNYVLVLPGGLLAYRICDFAWYSNDRQRRQRQRPDQQG